MSAKNNNRIEAEEYLNPVKESPEWKYFIVTSGKWGGEFFHLILWRDLFPDFIYIHFLGRETLNVIIG